MVNGQHVPAAATQWATHQAGRRSGVIEATDSATMKSVPVMVTTATRMPFEQNGVQWQINITNPNKNGTATVRVDIELSATAARYLVVAVSQLFDNFLAGPPFPNTPATSQPLPKVHVRHLSVSAITLLLGRCIHFRPLPPPLPPPSPSSKVRFSGNVGLPSAKLGGQHRHVHCHNLGLHAKGRAHVQQPRRSKKYRRCLCKISIYWRRAAGCNRIPSWKRRCAHHCTKRHVCCVGGWCRQHSDAPGIVGNRD